LKSEVKTWLGLKARSDIAGTSDREAFGVGVAFWRDFTKNRLELTILVAKTPAQFEHQKN
jgi:hypothetical protein